MEKGTICINNVEFNLQTLLSTFPTPFFISLCLSLVENRTTQIRFPVTIDPFSIYGERFMIELKYRITTGKYHFPRTDPKFPHLVLPVSFSNRFISIQEMEFVFDYLQINRKEIELIEEEVEYIDIETVESEQKYYPDPNWQYDRVYYRDQYDVEFFECFNKSPLRVNVA